MSDNPLLDEALYTLIKNSYIVFPEADRISELNADRLVRCAAGKQYNDLSYYIIRGHLKGLISSSGQNSSSTFINKLHFDGKLNFSFGLRFGTITDWSGKIHHDHTISLAAV